MTFLTEEQLESFIYDNRDKIHEKGLPKFYQNTIRQFRLPNNKIIDLFTYEVKDNVLYFRVIELKKELVWVDTITQALGYTAFVNVLTDFCFTEVRPEFILVGSQINNLALACTHFLDKFLSIYDYQLKYEGILFSKKEYQQCIHKNSYDFCNLLKTENSIYEGFLENSPFEGNQIENIIPPKEN